MNRDVKFVGEGLLILANKIGYFISNLEVMERERERNLNRAKDYSETSLQLIRREFYEKW